MFVFQPLPVPLPRAGYLSGGESGIRAFKNRAQLQMATDDGLTFPWPREVVDLSSLLRAH